MRCCQSENTAESSEQIIINNYLAFSLFTDCLIGPYFYKIVLIPPFSFLLQERVVMSVEEYHLYEPVHNCTKQQSPSP